MRWQVGAGAQRRELQRGHQRLRQCPAAAGGIGTAGGRLRIWGAAGGDKDGRTRVLFLRVPFLVSQANQRNTSFFGGSLDVCLCVCALRVSLWSLFFFFFFCVSIYFILVLHGCCCSHLRLLQEFRLQDLQKDAARLVGVVGPHLNGLLVRVGTTH